MYKFIVLAGARQHLKFRILWQIGGSRCVQNTPMGCGNDLPIFLRKHISAKNNVLMSLSIDYHTCSPICHFLLCFRRSATEKMTVPPVWDHVIVFIDAVFTSQIHALHAEPFFLMVCIIGIILYVQHTQFYLYIYIYIYISIFIYIYLYIYILMFANVYIFSQIRPGIKLSHLTILQFSLDGHFLDTILVRPMSRSSLSFCTAVHAWIKWMKHVWKNFKCFNNVSSTSCSQLSPHPPLWRPQWGGVEALWIPWWWIGR